MSSAKMMRNAAMWGSGLLQDNQKSLLSELGTGFEGAKGYLQQGTDLYGGLSQEGRGGLNRYQQLAQGGAGAMEALQQTPGYQFSYDQGLQALNRRRAAGGMLNSGNADTDAMKFGAGLASQTLNQERQAQIPLMNLYTQGIQGQAQGLQGLGGLTNDYYNSRAGVIDDTNKGIIDFGTQAFKATAQGKQQQQNNWMGGLNAATGLFGQAMGGGFGTAFGKKLFG